MMFFKPSLRRLLAGLIYKTYGTDIFKRYSWLISTLSWPPEKRQEWRLSKLNQILEFAWKYVPFYRDYWRDHGVQPGTLRSIDELAKYPVLTKQVFRDNAKKIRPTNLRVIRHRAWHTGGTTGEPVHYLRDLEQWTLCEAFHLWGWGQLGYRFGDPVGVIAGGSLLPGRASVESRIRTFLHNRTFLFGVAIDSAKAKEYHRILEGKKVRYLYGYPSIIYMFAKHLCEQGLSLPSLKAVITTGEMLLPQYRQGIQELLGCEVYDNLGCNDGGYESYECRFHRGLHYNDLQCILEVDEGRNERQEREGVGRLLITNLWNRSTPFIRYENGDMVSLEENPCPCGTTFPRIRVVGGRTGDILTFKNGKSLTVVGICHLMARMYVDAWEAVQTGATKLEIRLIGAQSNFPKYEAEIKAVLGYHLGDEIEVSVKEVTELCRTGTGKWKPVWSQIPVSESNEPQR
jgi:phenylacetate-CoA ligase